MHRVTSAAGTPRAAWVLGASLAVFGIIGCGDTRYEGMLEIAPRAAYDYHFYDEPETAPQLTIDQINEAIDRLSGPSWEQAKYELFSAGRDAIYELIKNLDRTEPTYVSVRQRPGQFVPEKENVWTLGQVVYSVLVEFVGSYTDYKGPIPPPDSREWLIWWKRNRGVEVRSTVDTAPRYVREQMIAAQEAIRSKFDRRLIEESKQAIRESDRDRERREQQKAQELERRRRLEEEKRSRSEARQERDRGDAAPEAKAEPVAQPKPEPAPARRAEPEDEQKPSRRSRRRSRSD